MKEASTMKHLALIALFVVSACSSKKTEEPAAKPVEQAKTGGPVKTDPKALFDEFTRPGVDGMALIDKYHDGATLSGKVSVKGAEEDGKPILWIMLDGNKHISLDYTDVAKAKTVKDGDTITVTCKVGGAMDNLMMLTDCT
jgi:hypothetical protein